MCTSFAPALRIRRTNFRLVVPRTIAHRSVRRVCLAAASLVQSQTRRTGLSFRLTPKSRTLWLGSMKVRPT
jgi:hypothetical protein